MRKALATTTCLLSILISVCAPSPVRSADLVWEVESPFRFFKKTSAFTLHERAFTAARGKADALPGNIVWRTERALNDPDCADKASPTTCANTKRANYERSRLGWAATTLESVCYERKGRPFRYPVTCERQYSWGTAKEDYVLPEAHTVAIKLAPERLAEVPGGECVWTWTPRAGGGKAETKKQACKDPLTIRRVPFSPDTKVSGVTVKVALPGGRELTESVIVEDVLVVAMGDSFMSGESNPDRPVVFSATREMTYDPTNLNTREDVATRKVPQPNYGLASIDIDPKTLPRRRLADEEQGLIFRPASREFQNAFDQRGAQWLSADCHRSQYGYPFRVGIQMALENRHRAVTLISVACSGADVTGLFMEHEARERVSEPGGAKVPPQLDQLADLLCRGGAAARTQAASYTLPMYKTGSTSIALRGVDKRWCPPAARKRAIDLVLLSIGGNDIGFGGLVMYATTESARDLAPIASLVGGEIRFGPDVSRAYLAVLDKRIKAVRDALAEGFGVEPSRVLQNAYEPIHFDEAGQFCGAMPTLGMDVHPSFKVNRDRLREASDVARELQARLECMANAKGRNCPAGLATGAGTGFRFITEHVADFSKRGICARDPRRALADQVTMTMPRRARTSEVFEPYSPAAALPYAARWRLIHNPNDAFLTANTHREGISPFDILQPAYAALYSGAFHPTAEGHAVVADHVMRHVRSLIDRKQPNVVEGRLH
jgi:lysophospholipase L1-like esterase